MKASTLVLLFVSVFFLDCEVRSMYLSKKADQFGQENMADPKKRPFCNAFTGCGKKRSNIPALAGRGESLDESIGSLLELNAEPAVENLSRQIMSEAKLWEAIQEANMELNHNRQESSGRRDEESSPVRPPASINSCAIPPCYT